MTSLEIKDLAVRIGEREVLNSLNLQVPAGSFTAILGPSGCGKTTLLRAIAGLVRPSAGAIRFGKQLVSVSSLVLPPHKRNIGYLPQDAGLFPHLTVADNVGFALGKIPKEDRDQLITNMLDMVGLPGFANRRPTELSGGQQTRVALARALVMKPSLVLLDEPFSNLDEALREEIGDEVVRLLKNTGTTTLMVTHDREDALVSADLIALMRDGTVVQTGSPAEVYLKPLSADIAVSTGDILTLPAVKYGAKVFTSPLHQSRIPARKSGEPGELLVRPEEIRVHPPRHRGAKAVISRIHYYGHDAVLELKVAEPARELKVRVAGPLEFAVGDAVSLEHIGPIRWVSRKATRE